MKPKKLLQFLQQQMAKDDTVLQRTVVNLDSENPDDENKDPDLDDDTNTDKPDEEQQDPDEPATDQDAPELDPVDDVDRDGDTDMADVNAEIDPELDDFPDLNGPMGTPSADSTHDATNDGSDGTTDGAIDAVGALSTSNDPNKQGTIRTVKGAKLVYKRQEYDGTYTELWMLNNSKDSLRDDLDIRRDVLSGTDIPNTSRTSDDGSQTYDITVLGNVQMLKITGLPN